MNTIVREGFYLNTIVDVNTDELNGDHERSLVWLCLYAYQYKSYTDPTPTR